MLKTLKLNTFGLLSAHAQLLILNLFSFSHSISIGRLTLLQRLISIIDNCILNL